MMHVLHFTSTYAIPLEFFIHSFAEGLVLTFISLSHSSGGSRSVGTALYVYTHVLHPDIAPENPIYLYMRYT
jgi:hypothetical protein